MLFLPQYHPEYYAIEDAWMFVKGWIRRHPTNSLGQILNENLTKAFRLLSADMAKNIVNKFLKILLKDSENL